MLGWNHDSLHTGKYLQHAAAARPPGDDYGGAAAAAGELCEGPGDPADAEYNGRRGGQALARHLLAGGAVASGAVAGGGRAVAAGAAAAYETRRDGATHAGCLLAGVAAGWTCSWNTRNPPPRQLFDW